MRTNPYGVPRHVRQRMYDILACALDSLLPPDIPAEQVIKPHVWYNAKYVGIADGQVQAWYGWCANLRFLNDCYRTLYIDYVANKLPYKERVRLFGEEFSQKVDGMESFVFFFTTSFPYHRQQEVLECGLTFRRMNDVIHPGKVLSVSELDKQACESADIAAILMGLHTC